MRACGSCCHLRMCATARLNFFLVPSHPLSLERPVLPCPPLRSDSNTFMSQKWACNNNFDLHRGYLYSRSERRRMKKSACSLPDPCTWPRNFTWQEPEQWTPKYLWQRSSPWGGFSPVSRWAPASQSTRQRSAVAPLTKKIGGKELFKDNRLHE